RKASDDGNWSLIHQQYGIETLESLRKADFGCKFCSIWSGSQSGVNRRKLGRVGSICGRQTQGRKDTMARRGDSPGRLCESQRNAGFGIQHTQLSGYGVAWACTLSVPV